MKFNKTTRPKEEQGAALSDSLDSLVRWQSTEKDSCDGCIYKLKDTGCAIIDDDEESCDKEINGKLAHGIFVKSNVTDHLREKENG